MSSVGRKPGRGRLWEGDVQSPLGTLLLLIFLPRSGGNGGLIIYTLGAVLGTFLLVELPLAVRRVGYWGG